MAQPAMGQETGAATERLSTVDPPQQAAVEPAATPALSNAAMAQYLAGFPPGTAPPSVPGQTAQSVGNAAMATVQARRHRRTRSAPRGRPTQAAQISFNPVIWTWQVWPRKRPVYKRRPERGLEQEALTLYKDDKVTLGVGLLGLNVGNREAYEPLLFTFGDAEVTEVEDLSPRFVGNAFVWTLRFKSMGHTTLAASFDGAGLHSEWTKKVKVYGDLTDFKQMLDRTSDLISADILEAGANVNDASAAYKAAYEKQKSVLDKEAKRRQMLEDMLWDALFAGLGGLTGGMVGVGMGKWLGRELKDTLRGGAAIDAVKDVTKTLTKSVAKMGKPAGSIQDLELKPISVDPLNFLLKWEAAVRREGAFLLRQIAKVKDYAGEAENKEATELFEYDLYASLSQDKALEFLKQPMSTDPKSYTRALWEQWLGEYGYEFIDEHWETDYEGPAIFVEAYVGTGISRGSKLEDAIIEAAQSTGMSEDEARVWYEEARRPALERAQRQLAERRAGREPTPHTPGHPEAPTGRPAGSPEPTHR